MKILIMCGGLATRLKGTEKKPKPLVEIKNSSVLTIIIEELSKLNIFDSYNLLICDREQEFLEWRESVYYNINIINEGKRTGRMGSLNFAINKSNLNIENEEIIAVANGDTIVEGISSYDIEEAVRITSETNNPSVLFARNSENREDGYLITNNGESLWINTGIFTCRKIWIQENYEQNKMHELDEILFKNNEYNAIHTEISMYDIGTIPRLAYFRKRVQ